MIKKEIEGKELKQVLHFRFSFELRFSEVDKSLFLAPPLPTTSCNVHYSGPILYGNERETWSKSIFILALSQWATPHTHPFSYCQYPRRTFSQTEHTFFYIQLDFLLQKQEKIYFSSRAIITET